MDLLAVVGLQNQLYPDQELDIIRILREPCVAKLRVLRDEIQRLCCEAERLEVQIHRYDIALAPHNKLPPEILRRILQLCCREPAHIPVRIVDAYAISHVCSLWRRIALDIPEFWGNISIKLKTSNEHRIRIARQWLLRAGNLPRSLTITSRLGSISDTWGQRVIHNLVMHYPCRELRLSLPLSLLMLLKRLLDGPFANSLEVLDLECSDRIRVERWPELFTPTTRLTKLHDIRLVGSWTSQNLMTAIPWCQLRYLTLLSGISPPRCLDILSQCTSLVLCRLQVDNIPVPTSARGPITLSSLRILRLIFRNEGIHIEQLIRFLNLPRLIQLQVTLRQRWHAGAFPANLETPANPAICELLQRSDGMPDLEYLDLGHTTTPINLRAILVCTPRLQQLHVRTGIFDEDLRDDIATGMLGPRLHSITTQVRHHALEILQMVELRHHNASMVPLDSIKQVTEFSRITFYCHRSFRNDDIENRLVAIKKAVPGLSIKFLFK